MVQLLVFFHMARKYAPRLLNKKKSNLFYLFGIGILSGGEMEVFISEITQQLLDGVPLNFV